MAAYVFFRYGPRRGEAAVFAAVALAVTFWILVEVADAAVAIPSAELPRIHERYLIYVLPLFITALRCCCPPPARPTPFAASRSHCRGGRCTLVPALWIPFGRVVNNTIVGDTFGLDLFARQTAHDKIVALHNPVDNGRDHLAPGGIRLGVRPGPSRTARSRHRCRDLLPALLTLRQVAHRLGISGSGKSAHRRRLGRPVASPRRGRPRNRARHEPGGRPRNRVLQHVGLAHLRHVHDSGRNRAGLQDHRRSRRLDPRERPAGRGGLRGRL